MVRITQHFARRAAPLKDVVLAYHIYHPEHTVGSMPTVFVRGLGMTKEDSHSFARVLATTR
jgi:hypothetical protein